MTFRENSNLIFLILLNLESFFKYIISVMKKDKQNLCMCRMKEFIHALLFEQLFR